VAGFGKLFDFDQTSTQRRALVSPALGEFSKAGIMADTKNDKHKDYCLYATRCLEIVPTLTDPGARAAQLEMAAKWLKLADETIKPLKVIQLSTSI
jgi:hypothetical protein